MLEFSMFDSTQLRSNLFFVIDYFEIFYLINIYRGCEYHGPIGYVKDL